MKMAKMVLLLAVVMLSSVAYAGPPDDATMARVERLKNITIEGLDSVKEIPPLPENWKEIVENGIRNTLKDPESARFRYPDEAQKYCAVSNTRDGLPSKSITLLADSPLLGHSGIVFVNAKNSFGGYVGEEPYWYMITDGKLSLLHDVSTPKDGGMFASLFKPVNSIDDLQFATMRWEGNYFMCK